MNGVAMLGAMLDGVVSIACGLIACYYGFRGPPIKSDPASMEKWQHWHETWGMWLKIGGVGLVLFGLFTVFKNFVR